MAMSINLAGFPPVLRARVNQGCGSTPGRAVVDCILDDPATWPDTTTLTISNGTTTLTWADMRMTCSPRVRAGYMRVVLEDSRWKLRHAILAADYNQLDSSGVSLTASQATMSTLASTLGTKASLTITAGGTVPSFTPPAHWRGMIASDALDRLLADSVCRLHFSPVTGNYSIWSAGKGTYPTLTDRLFATSPARKIRNVLVRSAPTLYERKMAATAVVEDGAGGIVNLSSNYPNEYFGGFPSVTDKVLQEKLRQGAYRFWKITATDRHLQNHRALSLLSGSGEAKYAGVKLTDDDLFTQLQQHELTLVHSLSNRGKTGSQIYHSHGPFIRANGNDIDTTAEILAAYYLDGSGGLQRESVSRSINGTGVDRTIDANWVRPVDSDQDDVPASQWSTILAAVADAYQDAFTPNPHTVTLPDLVVAPPSGHVGAVEYYAQIRPQPNLMTRFALDFDADPRNLS